MFLIPKIFSMLTNSQVYNITSSVHSIQEGRQHGRCLDYLRDNYGDMVRVLRDTTHKLREMGAVEKSSQTRHRQPPDCSLLDVSRAHFPGSTGRQH